ncbi:MAG TPA: Ig-like domain-containing protein [Candidatus Thermoplasmatota archaeon]|nr:Ig-like domain-containing protein [Candidatus Thermoplasmatota archaeon]
MRKAALALVVAMLLQAVPFGAGQQQNESELAFILQLAEAALGPLEGQQGFSTNQDDDGGFAVVEGDRWDGTVGKLVENSLASRTQPGVGILKSTDGGQTWAKRSFRFFALVDRTQASTAGVFFADSAAGPVDPANAELAVAFDGSSLQLTSSGEREVRTFPTYPIIMASDSDWVQFDLDFRGNGDVDVCLTTAPSAAVQESLSLNFAQIKLSPTGEEPPVANLDTVGLFIGGTLDRASAPRWGDILAGPRGEDLDLCRGFLDTFERYAVGSDLNGLGPWTAASRDPTLMIIVDETLPGGRTNRFVDASPQSSPTHLSLEALLVDVASASVQLRSNRSDEPSAGFFVENGTGAAFEILLGARGRIEVLGPDGLRTWLPGTYGEASGNPATGSFRWRTGQDGVACADGLLPGARSWAVVGDPMPDADNHPDFAWLPARLTLVHEGLEDGSAEAGWDDVLVAPGLDLCPVFHEDFDGLAQGDLAGQAGWSGAGGMKELVRYLLEDTGAVVEDLDGTEPVLHALEPAGVLSVGMSMAGSDASQRSAGFYLADSARGTAREDALLAVALDPGGNVTLYDLTGNGTQTTNGTHEVGHWLGLWDPSAGSSDSFFDIFVDLDLAAQEVEVCVRDPANAAGVRTLGKLRVTPFQPWSSASIDTLALDPGPDPNRTSVAAWDNVIYGHGDGDLCPDLPVIVLDPEGTLGANGWYVSDVTVTGACTDPETAAPIPLPIYSIEGSNSTAPLPANGVTFKVNDIKALVVYCEVRPGYWGSSELLVRTDGIPPSASVRLDALEGNNGWYRSGGQVVFTCVDENSHCARLDFTVDGVSQSASSSPEIIIWDIKDGFLPADGQHPVTWFATDFAGHVEPAKGDSIWIDASFPVTTVSLAGPQGDNGWFVGEVDVTLACADATSGPALLWTALDGAEPSAHALLSVLDEYVEHVGTDGAHTLTYYCEDVAGNLELVQSVAVNIDTIPPEVALTQPAEGSVHVLDTVHLNPQPSLPLTLVIGDLTVKADADDATSGVAHVEFWVDDQLRASDTTAPYAWLWDTALGDLGSHDLRVVARDRAGHETSDGLFVFTLSAPPL